MRIYSIVIVAVATFAAASGSAQQDARRLRLDTRKTLRLDYKSPSWNKDPNKVETSALLIRDAVSGRLVRIEVSETGPDTSLFVGYYQINFNSPEKMNVEITPEIYIVPKKILERPDAFKNVDKMIREQTLLRKPYFLRAEGGSIQAISIYDTKEQAYKAYDEFLKTGAGRPIVNRAALEAQQMAQLAAEERARREALLKAEAERKRLEDLERARQAELIQKQKQLAEAEKKQRQAKARQLAEKAMAAYKEEKFQDAEKLFRQSLELDPENQNYAFQYGVTLYRNEKYNESLVALNLADAKDVNPAEKEYYIALNHMRLKEYDAAYRGFIEVKSRKDKTLSPAAAFFAGVIDYQKENYDSAKNLFEFVLDNSSDPKLDQQAETYIEQIANIKRFQELQKKKFIVTANMGFMYDSNILAANEANTPTNLAGYRATYGGSLEYRPVYTQNHEFSAIVSLSDYYSVDRSFQPASEFQNSDALTANFKLPYKWKGTLLQKPYQISVAPFVESLLMNADQQGSRENIVNSTGLSLDQTFVMNNNWFSNYTLEMRRDVSLFTAAPDDNQTANKITLYTTQTFFRDAKKTTAWGAEFGYAINTAEGANQTYNQILVAGSYFAPLWKDMLWSAHLGFYNSRYPNHTSSRTDNNMSMNLGLIKPITESFSLNVTAGYIGNQSNMDTNTYNKYMLATTLAWGQNF